MVSLIVFMTLLSLVISIYNSYYFMYKVKEVVDGGFNITSILKSAVIGI